MLPRSPSSPPREPPDRRRSLPAWIGRCVFLGTLLAGGPPLIRAATPAGTVIANQAQASINYAGIRQSFASNTDRFEVLEPAPPPSKAELRAYRLDRSGSTGDGWTPAAYRDSAGNVRALSDVSDATLARDAISTGLAPTTTIRTGELIQLRVIDRDQNRYATEVENVSVRVSSDAGEIEVLQLSETGKDTGIFAGFITLVAAATCNPNDGRISAVPNSRLSIRYVDAKDSTDLTDLNLLVDPYGVVFDSTTGDPISGVRITMIDDTTGQPAEVFGLDGVSRYPSTVVTGSEVHDAGGAVYAPSPGAYSFPLVRPGRYRYRLEVDSQSGFSFPSAASATQLAGLSGGPFLLSPASSGGTFDVVLDAVKTDIPLDPESTALALSLSTPTAAAGTGDFVRYDLEVASRRQYLAFREVTIASHLPAGLRLDPKTLRREGQPITAQLAPDGRSFSLPVALLPPGETVRFSYLARVVATRPGRAVTTAVATAGPLHSAEASASLYVQDDLQANRAHLLGRVVRWAADRPTTEGLPGVAVLTESGAMVVTDARGFFHFEGLLPGTHVVQLDPTTLPKGAHAVLPRDSTENAGRASSRFVDLAPGSMWTADFYVELPAESPALAHAAAPATTAGPTVCDQAWIDAESPTYDWLEPHAATALPTPAVRILVKHQPAHKIRALLNGLPVDPIKFDGTLRSNHRAVAASLWSGVMLQEGDNTLEIVREDSYGIERGRETRLIRYAAPPVRAEFVADHSRLVADGLSPPVIAVRLFDRHNNPARPGTTGRFVVHEPFAAWRESTPDLRLAPASAVEPTQFTVGADGLALIKLQPVTDSGTVRLGLALAQGLQEIRADLVGHRDDWLVVGLAEGTTAWNTVNGHLENATADDAPRGFDEEGRVAFFAKGRVKGGWLLTAAYDSAKEKPLPAQSLHGLIDPDAYYTVYGDESQRFENAPSSRKLYVKLERQAVVALLGDFSLDWGSTGFTTYSRELHGAKVEYRGAKVRASAFQSDAGLTHARDEFRGSGLSGPYALRRRPMVAFSERIVLQERDRLRPDIVVTETPLARNVDYQVDSVGGIVWLSQPLFPSSAALNPQFLVVSYELEDQTAGVVQGARVEYAPTERVTVGASHVRQEQDTRTDATTGLDAKIQLAKRLTLTAEVARSDNAQGSADAYRADLVRQTDKGQARAYFREVGAGFGLNQLSELQLGNRQIGLEGSHQLTDRLAARGLLYQETVLPTGDQRRAGEAQLEWSKGDWTLRNGLRSSQDTRASTTEASNLFTGGVSRRFFHERLELRADREQSLGGESQNLDFPTRTVLGAKFAVTKTTALIAEQEWNEARDLRTSVTRLGATTSPWPGAALTGSIAEASGPVSGTTLGSGLNQTLRLTPALSVEGGLQRTVLLGGAAGTAGLPGSAQAGAGGFSSSALSSLGGATSAAQGESTSVFAGAHWKPGTVLYNLRAEFNDLQGTRRIGLIASAQAEAGHDLGLLGSVLASRLTRATGGALLTLDARLGAAWRPEGGSTTVLQRLDFVHVPGAAASTMASGWKVIENLHFNQRFGSRWQFSAHLGGKYVLTGPSLESVTTLAAGEARVNLTTKWDLGLNAATLSTWGLGTQQWSTGVSLGRTVAQNLWVSVGYNLRGFVDTDFAAARYTAPGVYIRFRLKFDQESLAGLINAIKAE